MEDFNEKKQKNEGWFSDPVYSHFGGYKMFTVHCSLFTVCKEFCLNCPAKCGQLQSRKKMAEHLTVCTEELISCKYASIGCDEVIKRIDLQTHLWNKKDYHLEKSMDMVVQLSTGTVRVVSVYNVNGWRRSQARQQSSPTTISSLAPEHAHLLSTPTMGFQDEGVSEQEGEERTVVQ